MYTYSGENGFIENSVKKSYYVIIHKDVLYTTQLILDLIMDIQKSAAK